MYLLQKYGKFYQYHSLPILGTNSFFSTCFNGFRSCLTLIEHCDTISCFFHEVPFLFKWLHLRVCGVYNGITKGAT